jgi:hypothetical protein
LLGLATAERALARSVLCRLVRIGKDDEGGRNNPIQVPVGDIVDEQRAVLSLLAHGALLTIGTGTRASASRAVMPEQMVGLADDRLVTQWPTMLEWLAEDRDFLLWRQQLRDYRNDWVRTRERAALLSGSLLGEARLWAVKRAADLNLAEQHFIDESVIAAEHALAPAPPTSRLQAAAFPSARQVLPAPPRRRHWLGWAAAAVIAIIAWGMVPAHKTDGVTAPPPAAATPSTTVAPPAARLPVPDLVGNSSTDAQKIAQSLGLSLLMVDAATKTEQAFVDGVVVAQEAALEGRTLRISVATKTTDVPLLVGHSLDEAATLLQKSGLKLQKGAPVTSARVALGTVVVQTPDPGAQVAAGSTVTVRVADAGAVIDIRSLRGFKVAIFFYQDDAGAEMLAGQIEASLRRVAFAGPIDLRPSTAEFMTEVYPPKTVEVRFEEGSEDAAASALQAVVEKVPGVGKVRKLPVGNRTVSYVSVFLPRSSPMQKVGGAAP